MFQRSYSVIYYFPIILLKIALFLSLPLIIFGQIVCFRPLPLFVFAWHLGFWDFISSVLILKLKNSELSSYIDSLNSVSWWRKAHKTTNCLQCFPHLLCYHLELPLHVIFSKYLSTVLICVMPVKWECHKYSQSRLVYKISVNILIFKRK